VKVIDAIARILRTEGAEFLSAYPTTPLIEAAAKADIRPGYFPLSADVLWNPTDAAAPYALIFDPRRWTPIAVVPAPPFRGWRYLDSPPGAALAPLPTADSMIADARRETARRPSLKKMRD
jgi:hypothetical protein